MWSLQEVGELLYVVLILFGEAIGEQVIIVVISGVGVVIRSKLADKAINMLL